MRIKWIVTLWVVLIIGIKAYAQIKPVKDTNDQGWNYSRLINVPTTKILDPKTMDVFFMHRLGNLGSASASISLKYLLSGTLSSSTKTSWNNSTNFLNILISETSMRFILTVSFFKFSLFSIQCSIFIIPKGYLFGSICTSTSAI